MKRTYLLLIAFFFSFGANAQTGDAAEFTFSDIAAVDSLGKDALYHNALTWIAANRDIHTILKDSVGGKLSGTSEFMVHAQSGVLQKISGKITYTYEVLVKDNKYRYHFSDFVFHYYKQDRNYKMVETGKTKLLTDHKAAGWQKLWDQHRRNTKARITASIADLNTKLVYKPKVEKEKVKKVEW